jgi:lysozyme
LTLANTPGVDVSRYQGEIDWKKVAAAGYKFAAIRATVGDYYTDPRFYTYWADAKKAGFLVVAYHVVVPKNYGDKQIHRYKDVLGSRVNDLPVLLDIERDDGVSSAAVTHCIKDCIADVVLHFKRKPLIYTARYFWKDHVLPSSDWAKYDLWVASYTSGAPIMPPGWTNWKFWQYSGNGIVPGISGGCDVNWFQGSYSELISYAGHKPTPPVEDPEVKVTGMQAKVLRLTMNIRSGPGIDNKIVGTLKNGAVVNFTNLGGLDVWVQSAPGKWSAQYNGGKQYLEIQPVEKGSQVIKAKVLVDVLNIRTGPAITYPISGTLKKGDTITITDVSGKDAWVQIDLAQWAAFTTGGIIYLEIIP